MSISLAGLADIPALSLLVNSAYRGESAKKGWTSEADLLDGTRTDPAALKLLLERPGSLILVARAGNGQVNGCVHLEQQADSWYLGMLTVNPDLQGSGIGRQLLQAAEAYVKKEQGTSISMTVISVRHELIAWYEKYGYGKTGETKPFPDNPTFGIPKQPLEFVVMKKNVRM